MWLKVWLHRNQKASKHHEKSCQTESRWLLSTFLLFVFSVEKEQLKPVHLIHKYNFEGKNWVPGACERLSAMQNFTWWGKNVVKILQSSRYSVSSTESPLPLASQNWNFSWGYWKPPIWSIQTTPPSPNFKTQLYFLNPFLTLPRIILPQPSSRGGLRIRLT